MPEANAPAPSHLPKLLLLLSATTGLVDAASVLGLGKVFTANMTGNIVFLGFAATGAPGFRVAPYLIALLAFALGATAGGRISRSHSARPIRSWLIKAALVEAVLFWIAAGVATRFDVASQTPEGAAFAIIALTALAMGFRNATVRALKVPDLTTTVLTLTVTGIAADSRLAGGDAGNLGRRFAAIFAIFGGAAIGGLLVLRTGLALPLTVAGLVVLVGTLLCTRDSG